ncbi:MAG TPA: 2-C-methyl-D-erythritol 4-phosphate cytidylyltransferase [Chloroflexota bacterium]|nr:2-C-methyl-D-erythritol 4-phosphate cytidylyltransferase [Chloroflexota bacterium]
MSGTTGVIVVGAGGGRRMGGVEKAFLPLLDRPLIAYSVEAFERAPEIDVICLVVSAASLDRMRSLVRDSRWRKVGPVVAGGDSRQESVRAGLAALESCEWLLVHDAARPLVAGALIARGVRAARLHGAAIPVVPVRDTIKRVRSQGDAQIVVETVDRTQLWAAQTPQVFASHVLREAFEAAGAHAARFTDDASLVEAMGRRVAAVEGEQDNVKLTYPSDLPLVEEILRRRGAASPT